MQLSWQSDNRKIAHILGASSKIFKLLLVELLFDFVLSFSELSRIFF